MADQSLDFISELTGLPQDKIGVKTVSKEAEPQSFIQQITDGKVAGYSSAGTLNPIEQISKIQNVSGIYTDSIDTYRGYGVPLNPFENWNEIRAENQGTFEKWTNGLTKAGITALGAVYENTVGVFAGLGSMATGGEYYDNFVGRQVDKTNEWAQKNLPNYYTQAERDASLVSSLGTANFWADKVANGVGYTLGSIATMWLGTGELGLMGRAANAAKALKVGDTALDIAGLGASAAKTANVLDEAAKVGSKQLALYRAGKAIETGSDLASLAQSARISTAVQRLGVATQMSLAEASVEARETKNRFIEEQTAKWEAENPGQELPGDVLAGIEESANAAGNAAFAINLPILATSNIIMFGKMFRGTRIAERGIYDLAEKEAATATKGSVWIENIGDSKMAKAFTKSQRMFGKPVGNMLTEGIQEGSQFAASEFSRDYYGDKFANGMGDMSKSLSESLSSTFGSKEGLENILIGAIVGGGTGAVSRIGGADSKLAKERTANSAKVLQYLNSGGMTRVLENMDSNDYNRKQVNIIEDANKIIEDPNSTNVQRLKAQQEANRARTQLIRSEARRYDKIGATDYMLAQLDDAALMSEDEFKKAHGYALNKSLQEQTGKTQGELVQEVKDTVELSMKRARQVEDILAKYQPKNSLLPKILDSLQSEETKANKALQQHVRGLYANMLHAGLMDIDVIDSQIDEMYDELVKSSPSLNELSKEDFAYKIKVGDVKVNEEGNLQFSTGATSTREQALKDKLNEIFKAKNTLNPADAESFKDNVLALEALIKDRERLTTAFDNIRRNPEQMDLYVEAQYLKRQAEEKKANAETAAQVIANAETADEIRNSMPDDVPEEVLAEAEARVEELEKAEQAEQAKLSTMTDEQLAEINEDEISPLAAAALEKEKVKREDAERVRQFQRGIPSPQIEQVDAAGQPLSRKAAKREGQQTASYEEALFNTQEEAQELSDAEAAAFFDISVSAGGFIFTIGGRTYLNLNDEPLDALIYDQNGERIGIKLTDAATGNEITWMLNAENENDSAIADTITYSILLQAASIRDNESQATISTEEFREILKIRGTAIQESVVEKHREELEAVRDQLEGKAKKFEITESFEDPEAVAESEKQFETFIATSNIGQTVGLTDSQVRAQIEVIKQDLIEIEKILKAYTQLAMQTDENGNLIFTKEDFDKDGEVRSLKASRKSHKALLTKKINELGKRKKALRAQQPEGAEAIPEEIEQTPTKEEGNELVRGEEAKIYRLESEITQLKTVAKELQKIADGIYPGQDVQGAKKELKNIKSKISRREENIRVAKELIERINEERESEELRQAGNTAEGAGNTVEGQEPEGTDIDPREGFTSEGMDGTTTDEELENIRKKREALNQIDDQTSTLGDDPEKSKDPLENQVKPIVVSEGAVDAPLVKGEIASSPDFKTQTVDDNGNTRSNMIQQKVGGDVIQLFPEMLTDNTVIPTGAQVIFEVDESTDWWNSEDPSTNNNKKDLTEDRYWEQVPIYIAVQLDNGQTVRVGMLAAYSGTGSSRKDIYTLYKKGLTPTSTINSKLFDTTNIANARTENGEVFFYPSNSITKDAPRIAFVKTVDGIPTWSYAGNPAPFTADNNTPGQIGIIVENPNGGMSLVIASTKNMTESGRTKAINHLIKDNPEPQLFGEIVGMNSVPVAIESEDAAIEIEDDGELKDQDSEFFKRFMHQAALVDGTVLFTFYSKSANKLVRVNAEELKKALLNQQFKFSFSDVGLNEKGFTELVTVKADPGMYQSIAPNLRQEFFDIIMTKKFQVSERSLYNTGQYVSALTGTTYDSYFDYLNSATEFEGEVRTEGKGANVILATDSPGNAYKSPFYDVGLEFTGLTALEGGTETQLDSETEEVDRAAKSADTTVTFVFDKKADIERRRRTINLQETIDNETDQVTAVTVTYVRPFDYENELYKVKPSSQRAYIIKNHGEQKTFDIYEYPDPYKAAEEWLDSKYNAELVASESKPTSTPTDPRVADIERNKKADLEQLKTISPSNYIKVSGDSKELLKKFREYLTDVLGWERMPIGFSNGNLTLDYLGTELKIPASVNILGGDTAILDINIEDVIEAKYDAELAALQGKPATTPATQPAPAAASTPIEGLNERLDSYGNAAVVLPTNFNEGPRPKGRLNAFKSSIIKVADNLQVLAALNLNEFDFLTDEDKQRLDALKPLAKEFTKINIDVSLSTTRTTAVEQRYAELTNKLANEFVDIIGKHVKTQFGKEITSSKPTTTPAVVAPTPVAQTLTDAPVDALPADLFGVPSPVPQKPVSSTIELPAALAKYAVSPEKAAELNSMNPTGAPMQDLGDEIERICNPKI